MLLFHNFAKMKKGGCVYILTNAHNNVIYVGVTSDLITRIHQHKSKIFPDSFTAKYNCDKLVYYESFHSIEEAIGREKNIKNWKREWKDALINEMNTDWQDLSDNLL
jgi:putative endonuclease